MFRRPAANTSSPAFLGNQLMQVLYRRLEKSGFDRNFVRTHVLPEWWDDALAENPANVALAEIAVARMLGFDIPSLRNPDSPLALPSASAVRLKRTSNVEPATLAPLVRVAERQAHYLSRCLINVPEFIGHSSASAARSDILQHADAVGLVELVDFAWRSGVLVSQVMDRPVRTGGLHGVAMFCGDQPAVVLTPEGTRSDGPPWLAFRLGHELGHILLGHVREGDLPILDASQIDDPDKEEREANAFALEVLTGDPSPRFKSEYGLTASRLAYYAPIYGHEHKIDSGTVALIYGYSTTRWGVTQNALKAMGLTTGAHQIVASKLRMHLEEDLSETASRAAALAGIN